MGTTPHRSMQAFAAALPVPPAALDICANLGGIAREHDAPCPG